METKIVAYIILFAVLFFAGATTFIYWGSRMNEWRNIFKKVMAEVEAEQANAVREEKPKEAINLIWVKRYFTVPIILLAVFIAEYFAVSSLSHAERIEVLLLLVAVMLLIVVLETLAIGKKEPQVRFWIRLGVTIFFEVVFAQFISLYPVIISIQDLD